MEENNVASELVENSKVAEYAPFYGQIAELEKQNSKLVFDYRSPEGEKQARSHIYNLRLSKGALERARKAAKQSALEIGRAIDSEAKTLEARIDAMIDVHYQPILQIENEEKMRVQAHREKIDSFAIDLKFATIEIINKQIAYLESLVIDESFQEFKPEAENAKQTELAKCRARLAELVEQERQIEQLKERERKVEEDRQRLREEQIRMQAEAAERGRQQQAVIASKLAQERAEREAEEAKQRLERERENTERARLQAIEDAKIAEEKKQIAIKEAEERAATEERQRQRAEAARLAEEERIRQQDKENRRAVNSAALESLCLIEGVNEELGRRIITAIAKGEVTRIRILY